MDVAPIWTQEPQAVFPALSHADLQLSSSVCISLYSNSQACS